MVAAKTLWAATALSLLGSATADSILKTIGYSTCSGTDNSVAVTGMNIEFNKDKATLTFGLTGVSTREQNVSARIVVSAYGNDVYSKAFNPCDSDTKVDALCPMPLGTFVADGSQNIPASVSSSIPALAFQIPDIAAAARLELNSTSDADDMVACVQASVTNGRSASSAAISWGAAAIAGAALVVGGVGTVGVAGASAGAGAGGAVGAGGAPVPSFLQVAGYMQGMAMNGMLSVAYPPVYRAYTENFGFSTGLVSWDALQKSIDNFRSKTGGNLTADSVEKLRNTTLVFPDGSTQAGANSIAAMTSSAKRSLELLAREVSASSDNSTTSSNSNTFEEAVTGIKAFVEKISVPKSNTFMTILLVVALVILSIVCGILLVKLVLELWAKWGSFPESLSGFRKHYWRSIARTITALIMLLYGVWALYCVFQFSQGDSWAAKTLAAITLIGFTTLLGFFSYKIWRTAEDLKKTSGSTDALYDKKELWVKYSMFYESYRKDYWWVFVPTILYAFIKGVTMGALDGRGRSQTAVQLVVEAAFLAVLVWFRPYERRSGNIINIFIQVVRVLSVCCILVFVEEFGISQTTQTVTGLVLIIIQSILTGLLAILILWNAIISCVKMNPHRKRRKDAEKGLQAPDDLTSFGPPSSYEKPSTTFAVSSINVTPPSSSPDGANIATTKSYTGRSSHLSASSEKKGGLRPASPAHGDRDSLIMNAAPIDQGDEKDGKEDYREFRFH